MALDDFQTDDSTTPARHDDDVGHHDRQDQLEQRHRDAGTERSNRAEFPRRTSVREHLVKAFAEQKIDPDRHAEARAERAPRQEEHQDRTDRRSGRFQAADHMEPTGADPERGPSVREALTQAITEDTSRSVPTAWHQDRDLFNRLDPRAQAKILERERIVDQHANLGKAYEPFESIFRAHGRSSADVARQSMAWFQGLSHTDPNVRTETLLRLGRSFGIIPHEQLPAALQQRIAQEHQQMQQASAQAQQRVSDHIRTWAAGKEHFDTLRAEMGKRLQAHASGDRQKGVRLLKDGRPDLDHLYTTLVRERGLSIGKPGRERGNAPRKGKSVRESIEQARRELGA